MPWKNGGGTTTQLAISPQGASMDNFEWRISTARVASDGPFSAFPGIDRSLAVLNGRSLVLLDGGVERCEMGEGGNPFVFCGEQAIAAVLKDGPVVDFNVMTRRSVCTHVLEILELRGTHRIILRGDVTLIHLARGDRLACLSASGQLETCAEGESLLIDRRDDTAIELSASVPSRVCLAQLTFKEARND